MPKHRADDDENMLKHFRNYVGLTQEEAALKVGVSRTLWSAWEGRNRPMTVAQLNAVVTALGLDDEATLDLIRWWGDACFLAAIEEG